MPLRDHFRSPVNDTHSWDEVHGGWPMEIVRTLRGILPPGFRAGPNIHLGSPFEVDVSAYDLDSREERRDSNDGGLAVAVAPAPTLTVDADLSEQDVYEVQVYGTERGRRLVAAIGLVSPSNKDRPEARDSFVGKVASLLQKGVCVSIVDLVTVRQANLYADLMRKLDRHDPVLEPVAPHLYAVTLRSRPTAKRLPQLDVWFYPMSVGQPLPTIPIWLAPGLRVMLPLETGYEETCNVLGIE
ncbi:MAG: DUF4058 family protein [Gemmataceae bacterium]